MHEHDGNSRLELTFDQLALVHKSLQAARTLGVFPPQDELFTDTIQLVDQALSDAVRRPF